MKIFNGTPHAINVIVNCVSKPEIRKLVVVDGVAPEIIANIPSSGMLSAQIESVESAPIADIPIFEKKVTGCDPIPKNYDIIIVSALYVSAARAMGLDTARLYTVADPVYSADGRTILGCKGICPAF